MPGLDNKLSNIIGTKLPTWVLKQLETRSNKNNQDSRDNDNILYLANKTAWVRLVSSVDIGSEDLLYFKNEIGANLKIAGFGVESSNLNPILNPTSLAKEYVLFGGTSKYLNKNSYQLRSGLGKDSSYGILGDKEIQDFGYKPMPGITSVTIDTQGRLGSVRAATINFKCWDKYQLDIIDALYFKLGFTMFLEWGHTYFYPSEENSSRRDPNKILSTELYAIDPFEKGLSKEDIQIKIAQNCRNSEGNYDAMLGIVTNFNFTYTQDGGYDCTLKLMALGVLGDSIRINNAGTLPNILGEEILKLNNTLIEISNSVNQSNQLGAASGANQDGNPQDLKSYPSCIQNLEGVKVADVSKSPSEKKNQRISTFAANATFEGENLYFYLDGQYQTTGFSKSGRWECVDGKLVLDRVESILAFLNSKINGRSTEPDAVQLDKIVTTAGYAGSRTGVKELPPLTGPVSREQVQARLDSNKTLKFNSFKSFDYLYPVGTRGQTLFFPRFGAALPTDSVNEFVSSITIDNNYLFEKVSNFLNAPKQTSAPTPDNVRSNEPFGGSFNQQVQSAANAKSTLEFLMFNSIKETDNRNADLLRLDINYLGVNQKRYYASIRLEFSRSNPNFKKEILNRQAVYEAAIKEFRKSPSFEFKTIAFEARPVTETYGTTVKPFGTVTQNDTNSVSGRYPVIKLSTTIDVPFTGVVLETKKTTENTVEKQKQGEIKIPVSIDLYITDTDIISSITPSTQSPSYLGVQKNLTDQNQTETPPSEETKPDLDAISTQIKQALNYQSTLEIMLRTIQLHALNKAINQTTKPDLEIGRTTYVLNIADLNDKSKDTTFLQQIFSTGVFSKFIQDLVTDPNNKLRDSLYTVDKKMDPYERFQIQSKYGFASSLMGNKEPIESIQSVDFKELLKAYVVPYQINQEIIKGTYTNHPVYISLGLLLMILNHSCTIYDTKEDMSFQTPLVYVDFNPEMNFCLTNTKHLSTNPWVCLIPFEGSDADYRKLFNTEILIDGGTAIEPVIDSEQKVSLFKPDSQDYLSGTLPTLKFDKKPAQIAQSPGISSGLASLINDIVSSSPYRGKVMNILLNIDYLVDTVQQYSYKDGTNSVYLKSFIEQILIDINKSLGNFNALRLSYNDSANTFQIVDDQFVPSLANEEQVTPKSNTTELPLLGKFSIAKNIEIKSEVSSKLSNMLAISANANSENKATLSTNGDPFGFVNTSYRDRYISNRTEVTGSGQKITNNDTIKISAQQFNSAISDFYSKINPSQTNVSHATNYYIDKMTKIKNQEYATRAAAMIPVSVNFTTDGISGLSMGQAFTVPDKLLPYTYTTRKIPGAPLDHLNNVGFAVVGLTHTIESNQWNTSVRANMIFLKDKTEFTGSVVRVESRLGEFGVNAFNELNVSSDTDSELSTRDFSNYPVVESNYSNIKFGKGNLGDPKNDRINPKLLDDINKAAADSGVVVTVTTAVSGHDTFTSSGNRSRHSIGNAVDISIIDGVAVSKQSDVQTKVNSFVSKLQSLGYFKNVESGKSKAVLTYGFKNHDNHIHVSNLT